MNSNKTTFYLSAAKRRVGSLAGENNETAKLQRNMAQPMYHLNQHLNQVSQPKDHITKETEPPLLFDCFNLCNIVTVYHARPPRRI